MKAVVEVFGEPLRPLGVFLPLKEWDTELSHLIWKEIYAIPDCLHREQKILCSSLCELTQNQIVDMLISRAVNLFNEEEGHMFRLGFRSAGHGNLETKHSGGRVECRFPNWIVSLLKTPVWERLLSHIGHLAMITLLWEFPLLVLKRNKGFIQLTGTPISLSFSKKKTPQFELKTPIRLSDFLSPRCRVSKNQANLLALKITRAKIGHRRLSRAWIDGLPLLQRLLENHRRCNYNYFLSKSLASANSSNSLPSNTEDLLQSLKRREVPLHCVSHYLKSILHRLVPKPLWGSKVQKRKLLSSLHRYVVASPHALLREVNPVRGLDFREFSWLHPRPRSEGKRALREWVQYLFHGLAKSIVCSRFVQLASLSQNVMYFRLADYKDNVVDEFLNEHPEQFIPCGNELAANKYLKGNRLSAIKPRFILKKNLTTFRLILNMSKPSPVSFNNYLRPAFHALTYEVKENPDLGGSFVQGMDQIYAKYLSFVRRNSRFPMCIVSVDVERCFDTMRPELVMEIAKETLQQEEYAISNKGITFLDECQGKVRTKRRRVIHALEDDQISLLNESSLSYSAPCLVTDWIARQYVTRTRALELIRALLTQTYVEFSPKHLHQMTMGVPQGSVLSTLLCRLYYGRFEKEELEGFTSRRDCLLMRFVDDFIFFCPQQDVAVGFQHTMRQGNVKFNCHVNLNKMKAAGGTFSGSKWIAWCGLLFHAQSGWVRMDYSSKDTTSGSRALVNGVLVAMKSTARMKCHALLLDLEINAPVNVFVNVGQMFVLCATRYLTYIKFAKKELNGLQELLSKLFCFVHALILSRVSGGVSLALNDVKCLGLLAFYTKFRRNQRRVPQSLICAFEDSVVQRRQVWMHTRLSWTKIERAIAWAAQRL